MKVLRKKRLEIVLSKLKSFQSPKIDLEQYSIPANLAAEMLYLAGSIYDDIYGKSVLELGTGAGRLAIGAHLLGAKRVVGVDVDPSAIAIARSNGVEVGIKIEWVIADIEAIRGSFDTVIMNPPFGTRMRHKDRVFLSKALDIGKVVYSLHKRSTRRYLLDFIASKGGIIHGLFEFDLEIPHMFSFHEQEKYSVEVDFYRILLRSKIPRE
jgi:putative methylase